MVDPIRKRVSTAPPVTSQPKADPMYPKNGKKVKPQNSSLNYSKKWIQKGKEDAVKVFQDKCWCQAIMMGVASFAMDRFNIFQTLVAQDTLITAFAKTEVDINWAEWAQGSDLLELKAEEQKRGQPISGMLKNKCSERCIRLSPVLRTPRGDQLAFPGSNTKVTYRDITIAHEALHKLFQELGIVEKLLSSNKKPENESEEKESEEKKWEREEELVRLTTLLYNDSTEYINAFEQSTPATKHLFSACPHLDVCDRELKAQPGGPARRPSDGSTWCSSRKNCQSFLFAC